MEEQLGEQMSGLMGSINITNTFSKLQRARIRLKNLYVINKIKNKNAVKKFQPDYREEGNTYLS